MAFPSVSQNYQQRRADLSIFPVRQSAVPITSGFGASARLIAGPGKAAQNYARILFTPLGSCRSLPGLGSQLVAKLRGGAVRTAADLAGVFAVENLRVLTYLKTLSVLSSDEQVATVSLDSYGVVPTGVTLGLTLTVASGDTLPFLLPVVWNV